VLGCLTDGGVARCSPTEMWSLSDVC